MLKDLSSVLKVARGFEAITKEGLGAQITEPDLDELVLKAFNAAIRAVKFLDMWEEDIAMRGILEVPPTPPAERTDFGAAEMRRMHETPELGSVVTCHDQAANNDEARSRLEQTSVRSRYSRTSQTYKRPGSLNSCTQNQRSASVQSQKPSVSHRVSWSARPKSSVNLNLASEKLYSSHDTFLGFLGSFIGLHLQSRSSAELLLTTQQSVASCRDMLRVVEEIWERDLKRSELLGEARDEMYNKITDLVGAARDVFRPIKAGEEDDILMPGEGKPLVDTATACVRGAGNCVAESRFVIERIGDFEFGTLGLGITDFENLEDSHPSAKPLNNGTEENPSIDSRQLSIPPEPSKKPPPPPTEIQDDTPVASTMSSPSARLTWPSKSTLATEAPIRSSFHSLLPPLVSFSEPLISDDDYLLSTLPLLTIEDKNEKDQAKGLRVDNFDVSSSGESSTYIGSLRDSETSAISQTSTRATSPEGMPPQIFGISSVGTSVSGSQITLSDDCEEVEVGILEKTYAHEIVYNKEGQISGGTLPALIERLTTHDSTPDATFVSTFYLTFRLFATPTEFASALIDRFRYVGESARIAGPVRLRVYNVFKGWLESHWRNDCDSSALELIVPFATRELLLVLPTAGKRLASLAEKVGAAHGPLVPRLVSSMGKTNTSIAQYISPDTPMPTPIISKSQLLALKNWKHGGASISILDFDPLELARQFTIKESRIFCSILPEELLAMEWMKKSGSMAVNVRAMSRLSTDLANLVADCILQLEDPKKRATVIKQWVKIANKCLELANYDSLIAIICSLNTSTILRLKRTWELVSSKTKVLLEQLKEVVDVSRNYAVLRQRLQNHVPPCLPFVGTYLTDLTFVDAGNHTTRKLPMEGVEESKAVINFDKHMKTAKIISDLQRFQIPYRFIEVPELQTWMQDQLVRVRSSDDSNVQSYYRRSLVLEPREKIQARPSPVESQSSYFSTHSKEKFEIFGMGWSHHSKEKGSVTPT